MSIDSTPETPASIASGGAAQDINTSNVFINGANIDPDTIPQQILDVANWGWGQTCTFVSTDNDTVSWGSGTFTSAGGDAYSIAAGNTGNMLAKTYIYLDLNVSETAYQTTTTSADSVGLGKVLVAVANPDGIAATFNLSEASQIVGDNILANTIDATKMNVGQLSAITANIGSVTSGTITGALVRTSSSGERVEMSNDEIRSYDSSGVLRAQLSGDSLFFLNSSGTAVGVMIGSTSSISISSALTNGNAALSGAGTGYATLAISGSNYFRADGTSSTNISFKDIVPNTDNTYELGSATKDWYDVYSRRFTLNGTTITDWTDISGGGTLSGLTIDTSKNWGGYDITNIDDITLSGSGSAFDCNDGYVDNCRSIYMETGVATNPTIDGQIRYYEGGSEGLRIQIAGGDYQFDATSV